MCVCVHQVIGETLPGDITEPERAMAAQPGMYGRMWHGQGCCYDEAYAILQDSDTSAAYRMPPSVHLCTSHIT